MMKVLSAIAMIGITSLSFAAIHPVDLQTEYTTNPLGIDTGSPRFNWVLESEQRAQVQKAYQILVSDTLDALAKGEGNLWDSGRVDSVEQFHIVYAGKPLHSGQRAYWKVRVWDGDGNPSDYSEPAWWEMGLLKPEDWQGQWIQNPRPGPATEEEFFEDDPALLLRKEFAVKKEIARARAYVSGLGYYELYLNGQRVGDRVLDPAWTAYSKRVLYSTYDVTEMLRDGTNAVGMMLGNGWYNPLPFKMWGHLNLREHLTIGRPRGILQLNIDYTDGTSDAIVTDTSWKTSDGPILQNSVYRGEIVDARLEQPGWNAPGFDDSAWSQASVATEKLGPLCAQMLPPITIRQDMAPVKITEPTTGVFIFDMGQNFAGWVTLRAKGPAGTKIQLRYGELLFPDGTLNYLTSCCGQIKAKRVTQEPGVPTTADQREIYILKGDGTEEFTPHFTFHGFRYVEVTGFPGKPTLDCLTGHQLASAVESVGEFSCSNDRFNRIQHMVRWTLLSNLFGVQSDCPHREKFGYGGDIIASSEYASYNFDMNRFYVKAVQDLADAVRENGGFTETAPFVGIADAGLGEGAGPIGWGTAHPWLQWQLYHYYGDRTILAEQYDATKRWVELLKTKAFDGILENGLSEHETIAPKPVALTGTAFYYYNVQTLANIARVLERKEDVIKYERLAAEIKKAFNQRFLKSETSEVDKRSRIQWDNLDGEGTKFRRYYYDNGTQASQAFPLYFGLVENDRNHYAQHALHWMVDDILLKNNGHLTTGMFATKFLPLVLSDMGYADVAYGLVDTPEFPGWGYMLENGATTVWEHWALDENTFSHNHPMFGSVSEWFFKHLGGIQQVSGSVGFDHIKIAPKFVPDLHWVKCRYRSVRGDIVCNWKRNDNRIELNLRVPANTTATLELMGVETTIRESGQPIENAEGIVSCINREPFLAPPIIAIELGSGTYNFSIPLQSEK